MELIQKFLNKEFSYKIDENNSLQNILKIFLNKNEPIIYKNDDTRFMDSFDHVLNLLVNQYEGMPL